MANKIKFKRGLHQNLPVLDVGEPAFTTDTKEFYIGTATGNVLVGAKVDDNTIKLNESNQIYVDEIAIAKVIGLAGALGLKVDTSRKINGKMLSSDVTLLAKDIEFGEFGTFADMSVEAALEQLDGDVKGIVIPTVPVISTDIGADSGSDAKTASPKAVKTYVDNRVAATYKASGSLAPGGISNALLIAGNLGNVYNITGSFNTTADFIEGAGVTHPAGTNIVVVKVGAAYKFDVLSGFVDTSAFLTAIPQADGNNLGGIKAKAKSTETVEVAIDTSTGKLYVPTYTVNTDTKNTTGTTNKTATKLYLVGAENQSSNPQTYSNSDVYVGTDNELYSNNKKVLTAVPQATTGAFGGIKTNYTTVTPKHRVELDGSGNAFVNLTNLTIDGGEW